MVDRAILIAKITGYLAGTVTKDALYEWALFVAVSREYEAMSQQDVLVRDVVQSMMNINHHDPHLAPSAKMFEYYRRCLAGEAAYDPAHLVEQLAKIPVMKDPAGTMPPDVRALKLKPGHRSFKSRVFRVLRFYVVSFAYCSLGIQLVSILNPSAFHFGENIPSSGEVLKDAVTQIIYALLLLLPLAVTAREPWAFVALPATAYGVFYYGQIAFELITKLNLNVFFIVAILPFSVLPATIAFLLLVGQWKKLKRDEMAAG